MSFRICYEHKIGFHAEHGTMVSYKHEKICDCTKYVYSSVNKEEFESDVEANDIEVIDNEEIEYSFFANIQLTKKEMEKLTTLLEFIQSDQDLKNVREKIETVYEHEKNKY